MLVFKKDRKQLFYSGDFLLHEEHLNLKRVSREYTLNRIDKRSLILQSLQDRLNKSLRTTFSEHDNKVLLMDMPDFKFPDPCQTFLVLKLSSSTLLEKALKNRDWMMISDQILETVVSPWNNRLTT